MASSFKIDISEKKQNSKSKWKDLFKKKKDKLNKNKENRNYFTKFKNKLAGPRKNNKNLGLGQRSKSLNKKQKINVIKGIIAFTAFSFALILSLPFITPELEASNDTNGNNIEGTITYDNENAIDDPIHGNLQVYNPEYSKNIVPVLVDSNRSNYIDSVGFYDKENNTLDHSQIKLEDSLVYPILSYINNKQIPSNETTYTLKPSEYFNNTNIRLIFDISNFSVQNLITFKLNFSITSLKDSDFNITIYQNNLTKQSLLLNNTFSNELNNSLSVLPTREKYIDLLIFLNSNSNFTVNFTSFVYMNFSSNEDQTLFHVENNNFQNSQFYTLQVNFTEIMRINGIDCQSYNLTFKTIVDNEAPVLNYEISFGIIKYNLTDNYYGYGSFSYFDENNNFVILNLTAKGVIDINPNLEFFNGVFFVFDKSGNILDINIEYNQSLYNSPSNPQFQSDLDNELDNIKNTFTGLAFFSVWAIIAIVIIIVVIFSVFLISKYLNKKTRNNDFSNKFQKLIRKKKLSYVDKDIESKIISLDTKEAITLTNTYEEQEKDFLFKFMKTTRFLSIWLSMALIQTAFVGFIIYYLERIHKITLYANNFKGDLVFNGEVGIMFFIIFFITDISGEFIRSWFKMKFSKFLTSSLLTALIVSWTQIFLFLTINECLIEIEVFGVFLSGEDGKMFSDFNFYLFFFFLIFIAEFITDFSRSSFNELFQFYNIHIDKRLKENRELYFYNANNSNSVDNNESLKLFPNSESDRVLLDDNNSIKYKSMKGINMLILVIIGIWIILAIVFGVYDLEISKLANNYNNSQWAILGDIYGDKVDFPIIFFSISILGVGIFIKDYKNQSKVGLLIIMLSSITLIISLIFQMMIYAFQSIFLIILLSFFMILTHNESWRNYIILAISLMLLLFFLGLIVTNMKFLWNRVRFNDLSSNYEFTRWFIINEGDGNRSFPSGHTAIGWSVLPFLFLLKKKEIKIEYKIIITIIVISFGLFVAISRVLIGDHYASDVLFSTGIASLITIALYKLFYHSNKSSKFKLKNLRKKNKNIFYFE